MFGFTIITYLIVNGGHMNLLFTISAVLFNLLIAGIFLCDRLGKMQWVKRIGIVVVLLIVPFTIVLINWLILRVSTPIILALVVVLLYLFVEILLDFILKVDFRTKWSTHIPYILLEYGAFFSLIYIASNISKTAMWWVSITF